MAGVEPGAAADHSVFLAQQVGDVGHVGQKRGGDIATPEVLRQRVGDIGLDHLGRRCSEVLHVYDVIP